MSSCYSDSEKKITISLGLIKVVIIIFFSLRLITGFPLPNIGIVEIPVLIVGIVYALIRIIANFKTNQFSGLHRLEVYILLLLILPVYSGWRAYEVFGQPFIYGVLTQRSMILPALVIMLMQAMRKGTIKSHHLRKGLLFMAWSWLIYCALIVLFINPSGIFVESYPLLVSGNEQSGYIYKFEPVLLTYAFLYYFFKGFSEKKYNYYVKALPFLVFLLFVIEKRSLGIALLLGVLWSLWVFVKKRRMMLSAIKTALFIFFLGVIGVLLFPEYIEIYFDKYAEAISVVFSGEKGSDVSANVRITETILVWPYITNNWLLGNGDLSNQWSSGYNTVFGYFYPSDIGILGALFIYGITGLLFFYSQYLFLFKREPKGLMHEDRLLMISSYGVLIVLLIQSTMKGGLVFYPATSILFVAIIEVLRIRCNDEKNIVERYCLQSK